MPARFADVLQKTSALVLLVCLCGLLAACGEEPPLRIGFVGGLSGRTADLGVAGRDGVTLAVEERNRAGGIAGRQVELLVRDDRQDAEAAQLAVRELVEAQVLAVIGHMTSAMSLATVSLADAEQIVMLSPTTKTDQLTGLDDYFLRVTQALEREAGALAELALGEHPGARFAIVYDRGNAAFSEPWLSAFRERLEAGEGQVVHVEGFTSGPGVHFLPIAERMLAASPDSVLFVSNAIDTALLAQQLYKLEQPLNLYSTTWAFTADLISFGGRAVHGMQALSSFDVDSSNPRYRKFREHFAARFGSQPSFASVLSYDAASYLLAGLEKNPKRQGLKEALLELGPFRGLQADFTLNRYGDVERKMHLTRVTEEGFRVVE